MPVTTVRPTFSAAVRVIARARVDAVRRNAPSTTASAGARARIAGMVDLAVELFGVDEVAVVEAVDDVLAAGV